MTDNYYKLVNFIFFFVLTDLYGLVTESVTLSCTNGNCRTCINDFKCYPRQFKAVRVQANCPIAVCDDYCTDFIQGYDGCPVCQCNNGFCAREPCNSLAECHSSAKKCENFICWYQSYSGTVINTGSLFENPNSMNVYNGALVQNVEERNKLLTSFPSFPWFPNFPNLNNNNGRLFGGRN